MFFFLFILMHPPGDTPFKEHLRWRNLYGHSLFNYGFSEDSLAGVEQSDTGEKRCFGYMF